MNVIGVTKHPDKKRVTENLEFVNEIHGPDRLQILLPTLSFGGIVEPLVLSQARINCPFYLDSDRFTILNLQNCVI